MKRRTAEEVERARMSTWTLLGRNGWSLYTTCSRCNEVTICRGRTREAVRCRLCFLSSK